MKQLLPAFNKIRKLSVHGIFVEFNLEWTVAFLVAAPCIEMLHIEISTLTESDLMLTYVLNWSHKYRYGNIHVIWVKKIRRWYPKRRTPRWKMHFDGSMNSLLKESILERAPNMQRIVLKGDEQCGYCDALDTPPRLSKFPKKNDEQEIVVKRIRDGIFSPQIFFDE
ncbi:hypothetical protein VPH35_004979 [Triticum aestivum]